MKAHEQTDLTRLGRRCRWLAISYLPMLLGWGFILACWRPDPRSVPWQSVAIVVVLATTACLASYRSGFSKGQWLAWLALALAFPYVLGEIAVIPLLFIHSGMTALSLGITLIVAPNVAVYVWMCVAEIRRSGKGPTNDEHCRT